MEQSSSSEDEGSSASYKIFPTSFGNVSLITVVTTARYLFLSRATSTTSTPCHRSTKAFKNIPKHFWI